MKILPSTLLQISFITNQLYLLPNSSLGKSDNDEEIVLMSGNSAESIQLTLPSLDSLWPVAWLVWFGLMAYQPLLVI